MNFEVLGREVSANCYVLHSSGKNMYSGEDEVTKWGFNDIIYEQTNYHSMTNSRKKS